MWLQARNDAVELKLRVLDDKLLRAQISEEDKLKVVTLTTAGRESICTTALSSKSSAVRRLRV